MRKLIRSCALLILFIILTLNSVTSFAENSMALTDLSINYLGFSLLFLGIVFIVMEVFIFSFGVLGTLGLIAFIVGSVFLSDTTTPGFHVAWPLILAMILVTGIFLVVAINLVIRATRKKIVSGKEGLIGKKGIVLDCSHPPIMVRVEGELWEASSHAQLHRGDAIRVLSIHDLHLTVEPVHKNGDL